MRIDSSIVETTHHSRPLGSDSIPNVNPGRRQNFVAMCMIASRIAPQYVRDRFDEDLPDTLRHLPDTPRRHRRRGADKGTVEPNALPPLEHPDDAKTPAKQLFGRVAVPTQGHGHVVGFYAQWLPCGRPRASHRWPRMAGDAALPQSQLGSPGAHRVPGKNSPRRSTRRATGTASWWATCRSRAAGR